MWYRGRQPFLRYTEAALSQCELALFPLSSVLFPGGVTTLCIREARHLDVIAKILKTGDSLGVVLAEDGQAASSIVDKNALHVARVGSRCTVQNFDQNDQGQLTIEIQAQQKFKILDTFEDKQRAMFAQVLLMTPEPVIETGPEDESLIDILEHLLAHPAVKIARHQIDYQHLANLGGRLAELLPLKNTVRQRMLEIHDPVVRLNHLEKILDQLQTEAETS